MPEFKPAAGDGRVKTDAVLKQSLAKNPPATTRPIDGGLALRNPQNSSLSLEKRIC
jgi:hypothetical protein